MRKALVAGIVGLGLLGGCYSKLPDGNGTASVTWKDQAVMKVGDEILIGHMTTIMGTMASGPSYYRQVQQLKISNGDFSCSTPLNERWGGGFQGSFAGKSYRSNITCSDGSEGSIQLTVEAVRSAMQGLGIGKLSNGKKLRLTFGPSIHVTNTNF